MPKHLEADRCAERYFDPSSANPGPQKFVLIVGGVGAGKTTLRRQRFGEGYVVVDGGEIFRHIDVADPDDIASYMPTIDAIGAAVAERAIRERRNIVMEVIGDDERMVESIRDAANSTGYTTSLAVVTCDPTEAVRSHQQAMQSDEKYLSSNFTQDLHRQWIVQAAAAIGLGSNP